jgi:PAS domain S-box-containing protein
MGTDTKEIAHLDADRNLINVLLVEDDAVDARLVERILAQSPKPVKFALESVGSLSAAIDCLSSKKFDTVLLDLELPDSSGIETIQKVKQAIPHTLIVVLTGINDEEMGPLAIRNGASDYLRKNMPLDILLVRTIIYALERKKTIEALAQSESKFRTLVEHIPNKIFIKDKNFAYLFLNKNYAQDLKITHEEIIGKTDYDFYPKELAEKYRADDKRIIETGKTEDIEEKYIENGKERWVHTIKTPYKDAKGNIIGVLGIFRDITEQKKTKEFVLETNRQLQETSQKLFIAKQELENKNRALEKAQEELEKRVEERTAELAKANKTLQATKANLQEMIRQNADGIVIVDSNGTLHFVNPAACSLFNRKPEELIGEVFGFPVNIGRPTEIEVFRRNGKSITAEMHTAEIEWEGESANLISIRDITERKQAEETLKKANEKLTEYNQLKDEFVSTASHAFNHYGCDKTYSRRDSRQNSG